MRFLLLVLFMNQFPSSPTTPVANGKNFNQKNFNNFIWSPLGSRGNIHINFCLQVHFQVSAAWYYSNYLPPPSLTRRQICRRNCWHWLQICHCCQQHKGNWWQNLPPVSLTLCHRCQQNRWCTLTCEYLREFWKKFKMILMLLSGDWGKQKISWHCPFKFGICHIPSW